jgi:nitrogen PTS system EIIA component
MAMIRDMLHHDLIINEIGAKDKIGVIREFAQLLCSTGRLSDEEAVVHVLMEREALGSTGIGDGVAIPHGKLPNITDMVVAFGRSSAGIDFDSMDAKPVHLFFLLVTPEDKPGDHLRALARISRILKNPDLREKLKLASERDEILRMIYEEDGKYPQPPQAVHR